MATTKTLRTDEGHETTLDAWAMDNAEWLDGLDRAWRCEILDAVEALAVGETYSEPGGGSAAWSVTRTA